MSQPAANGKQKPAKSVTAIGMKAKVVCRRRSEDPRAGQESSQVTDISCSDRDIIVQAVSEQVRLFRRFVPGSGTPLN